MAVDIRPAINKVIDDFGFSVTFTNYTDPTYSEDTGWSENSSGTEALVIVPWDLFADKWIFSQPGINNLGETKFACKGTATVSQGATFTYLSRNYKVTQVNPLPFSTDSNGDSIVAAQIIEASEQLS